MSRSLKLEPSCDGLPRGAGKMADEATARPPHACRCAWEGEQASSVRQLGLRVATQRPHHGMRRAAFLYTALCPLPPPLTSATSH
eukprot:357548-Chlamydomonas_euryale.AAC.3